MFLAQVKVKGFKEKQKLQPFRFMISQNVSTFPKFICLKAATARYKLNTSTTLSMGLSRLPN